MFHGTNKISNFYGKNVCLNFALKNTGFNKLITKCKRGYNLSNFHLFCSKDVNLPRPLFDVKEVNYLICLTFNLYLYGTTQSLGSFLWRLLFQNESSRVVEHWNCLNITSIDYFYSNFHHHEKPILIFSPWTNDLDFPSFSKIGTKIHWSHHHSKSPISKLSLDTKMAKIAHSVPEI